jgi:hypothetical protein
LGAIAVDAGDHELPARRCRTSSLNTVRSSSRLLIPALACREGIYRESDE